MTQLYRWVISQQKCGCSVGRMIYQNIPVATERAIAGKNNRNSHRRYFATTTGTGKSNGGDGQEDSMRVAVIGGGVGGLSAALHLAPLVSRGIIEGPIDIYEKEAAAEVSKRDIGVGIWSTAMDGFRFSQRESHAFVWNHVTSMGSWVGEVGYRTPQGSWLLKSKLPIIAENDSIDEMLQKNKSTSTAGSSKDMPSLLFLREKDLISSLQEAVEKEQSLGTIQIHHGGEDNNTLVTGICEQSQYLWSSPLMLGGSNGTPTERDYHLIVGAGGTFSILRKTYGGVLGPKQQSRIMGTTALADTSNSATANTTTDTTSTQKNGAANSFMEAKVYWQQDRQEETTAIIDRQYTVFRGNAKLTVDQVGENGISFQTWGEGNSMRFATVPMRYPSATTGQQQQERQVWFITINDDTITKQTDPVKRRDMLLSAFSHWHDPICQILQATPPEQIIMERAVAHKHVASPILEMNQVLVQKQQQQQQQWSSQYNNRLGHGPAVVFVGDAFMTVDPILAQGFSFAMESAKCLSNTIQETYSSSSSSNVASSDDQNDATLSFDPYKLRRKLKESHHERQMKRLLRILRITELVQTLGQPKLDNLTGKLNKYVIRPCTRITPNFIKQPIFDAVLKYSLGFSLLSTSSNTSTPTTTTNNETENDKR